MQRQFLSLGVRMQPREQKTVPAGGAIKVASLVGAIFRHKDRKRGQQDTLRYFWDHETGLNICFPDTSNTRFQSHAAACEIIVLYMELLLQFLVYVRENKGARTLNHMELNVQRGLMCGATRHEFVVIALLHQNVDVPYMLEVRGPLRTEKNLLKLGALHKKVKAHLGKIIANPKLVTGADMSFETASLNGQRWEKQEVVYAALARISEWNLEHVDSLVVGYCKGALVTWSRFDTEWSDDGPISKLTPENIEWAWLEVTNDGNESELGIMRGGGQANNTSTFAKTLSAEDQRLIRAQVRKDDVSGTNTQQKHEQIVYMKAVADKNVARDAVRNERVTKVKEAVAKTTALASVAELDTAFQIGPRSDGYLSVAALDLQLDWHLANAVADSLGSSESSASGIPKAKTGPNGRGNRVARYGYLREAIIKRTDILQRAPGSSSNAVEDAAPADLNLSPMDVDDGGYDSEEDFYGPKTGLGL
ncbi:hypothetical protein B0H14DRAFT_3472341 [Mycena olivaceomarginata]|nr:hypothetical protein B0H14DRAFT_3472341 [Mycena olivaceomarginata]